MLGSLTIMQSQFWLVMAQYCSKGAGVSFDQVAQQTMLDILPPGAEAISLTLAQLDRLLITGDAQLASSGTGLFASSLSVDITQTAGLCALLCAKPNFGSACRYLTEALHLAHPGYRCWLEPQSDGTSSMTFAVTQVSPDARHCHEQVLFGMLINLLRQFPSEDGARVRKVMVSQALQQRYPELAVQSFELEVSDERSGILMDDAMLMRSAQYYSSGMERTLQIVFDATLAHDCILESYASQVVDILLERLTRDQSASLGDIATEMGLKMRTLQYYLSNENVTFNYLRGHVMAHVACDLITDGYTIDEVVRRLGYSSRSAFHHAFTRNTGLRPTQVRRGLRPQCPVVGVAPPPSTL